MINAQTYPLVAGWSTSKQATFSALGFLADVPAIQFESGRSGRTCCYKGRLYCHRPLFLKINIPPISTNLCLKLLRLSQLDPLHTHKLLLPIQLNNLAASGHSPKLH
jgi:hypothetical protein